MRNRLYAKNASPARHSRLAVIKRLLIVSVLSSVILTACGGNGTAGENGTSQVSASSEPVALTSIKVTPINQTIPNGLAIQFTASGTYSDGTSHDITSSVTWSSSSTSVATIDGNGLVSTLATGSATITAALAGISDNTTLTVNDDTLTAISVTPGNATIPTGLTKQFVATGTYSSGNLYDITKDVTWKSSTAGIASINDTGLATAVTVGSSSITATLGSVSGEATFTVSSATLENIVINPLDPTIAAGVSQQFTATGYYSDGTTQDITSAVAWSTGNSTIAVRGSNGAIYAIGAGSSAVTATLGAVSAYTTLTVTPAPLEYITVQPSNPTTSYGIDKQLSANGLYADGSHQDITTDVTWSSSDTNVATVNGDGLVSPVTTNGTATITATMGDVSESATLTVAPPKLQLISVSPSSATIPNGLSRQFTATGYYSDGTSHDVTSTVNWNSRNPAVATVNSAGLVAAAGTGSTSITATIGTVSVTAYITVSLPELQTITITPMNPTIALGLSQQFTAVGNYSDGSTSDLTSTVTWSSDDTRVAPIAEDGLASTAGEGSALITATTGTISDSTTLAVGPVELHAIKVTPSSPMIANGASQQMTAAGIYSDGTVKDITGSVTWDSQSTSVATIDSTGLVRAVGTGLGSSVITATLGSVSGETTLTTSTVNATAAAAAYQIDPGHSGTVVWDQALSLPDSPAWQADLGGTTQFALIANGRVFAFVRVSNADGSEGQLVALDVTDGSTIWGPIAVSSGGYGGGLAYDDGKLYALNSSGLLASFDAATGKAGWSTVLNGQNIFDSPPVAANGRIFAKGAGPVAAIDETNGATIWTGGTGNGTDGSPALDGTGVFFGPPCEADGFDQATGSTLWQHNYGCTGGGGTTPVAANGLMFELDDYSGNHIFNSKIGTLVGTFPGTLLPAVGSSAMYTLVGGTLQALDLSNQQIQWSFAGDGTLYTAPIVVDNTVFIGATGGTVYGVDAATGEQVWSAAAGGQIPQSGGWGTRTGLEAANGYLIVPAGNGLTAWQIAADSITTTTSSNTPNFGTLSVGGGGAISSYPPNSTYTGTPAAGLFQVTSASDSGLGTGGTYVFGTSTSQ